MEVACGWPRCARHEPAPDDGDQDDAPASGHRVEVSTDRLAQAVNLAALKWI